MKYLEAKSRRYAQEDPGASLKHAEELIQNVAFRQRQFSIGVVSEFIDTIRGVVSPQVVEALKRSMELVKEAKLEEAEIEDLERRPVKHYGDSDSKSSSSS